MEEKNLIAKRLLQLCAERNMTVGKLCTTAGATASTVHDIITGTTKNPRVFTLKKLCDALGITLSEFFDTVEFNNMEQEID